MPTSSLCVRDPRCSFCGKGRHAVRQLIAGPGRLFICDGCVHSVAQPPAESDAASATCSFCGRRRQAVIPGTDGAICGRCIDLCHQLLAGDLRR
jgi:ATP-dependent protease Clp ATPase subunit